MVKTTLNKIILLAIFTVFASNSLFALTGKFKVGAKDWIVGTLVAETVTVDVDDDGILYATASGPWEIRAGDKVLVCGSTEITFEYSARGGGGDKPVFKTKGKIVSTNDGLSITSDEQMHIEIYDVSGRSVYTNVGTNVSIDQNTLNLKNGTYMLRFVNKEGEEQRTTFIFDGNTFMISNSNE